MQLQVFLCTWRKRTTGVAFPRPVPIGMPFMVTKHVECDKNVRNGCKRHLEGHISSCLVCLLALEINKHTSGGRLMRSSVCAFVQCARKIICQVPWMFHYISTSLWTSHPSRPLPTLHLCLFLITASHKKKTTGVNTKQKMERVMTSRIIYPGESGALGADCRDWGCFRSWYSLRRCPRDPLSEQISICSWPL